MKVRGTATVEVPILHARLATYTVGRVTLDEYERLYALMVPMVGDGDHMIYLANLPMPADHRGRVTGFRVNEADATVEVDFEVVAR